MRAPQEMPKQGIQRMEKILEVQRPITMILPWEMMSKTPMKLSSITIRTQLRVSVTRLQAMERIWMMSMKTAVKLSLTTLRLSICVPLDLLLWVVVKLSPTIRRPSISRPTACISLHHHHLLLLLPPLFNSPESLDLYQQTRSLSLFWQKQDSEAQQHIPVHPNSNIRRPPIVPPSQLMPSDHSLRVPSLANRFLKLWVPR